jgi:ferredoxin
MRLVIDYSKCRKAHQCVYLHPELFKTDAAGAPVVLIERPGEELRPGAEEALDLCPNGAISLKQTE